jgi:hypothetical protein
LIDFIVGVLMPLYTHLLNLMADVLLEETDYPDKPYPFSQGEIMIMTLVVCRKNG